MAQRVEHKARAGPFFGHHAKHVAHKHLRGDIDNRRRDGVIDIDIAPLGKVQPGCINQGCQVGNPARGGGGVGQHGHSRQGGCLNN